MVREVKKLTPINMVREVKLHLHLNLKEVKLREVKLHLPLSPPLTMMKGFSFLPSLP